MVAKKPRAFRCGEASRSPMVETGASGTRRREEPAVGPDLEGELGDGRQALLRRSLHVLAASRRRAGEGGAERADGRVQTGLEARLVAERLEGWEVGAGGLAVQRRDAARA